MGSIHWMVEKSFLLKLFELPVCSFNKLRLLILSTHYASNGSISAVSLFWTRPFIYTSFRPHLLLYNGRGRTLDFWIMADKRNVRSHIVAVVLHVTCFVTEFA